ncbi:MAG: N-acetylmuramic acid 6-phosphate etherase [Thermodesulfobacteriales bacterium]|nr:MAG: N-acetylmuramic acid 6-phosphate etherase [Thermodesulfobacteriales bacterium]
MTKSRKTGHLLTEKINPRTVHLDKCSPLEVVELILEEDRAIVQAIEKEKHNIAKAVELVVGRLKIGGRLFFIGAGTSGRLGVIEAAECPPTFGTDPELIQGFIAGGREAIWQSIEGAEDSTTEAQEFLQDANLCKEDVVVGIAASASTPFVEGGLQYADQTGSGTVLVTCNTVESKIANVTIELLVGPEVVVGSTRMKAGTVTKMVLNMMTTASMVQLGKTYGNLMVDVQPKSAKLRDRAKRIVMHIAEVSEEKANELLQESDWDVKASIVMEKNKLSLEDAKELLEKHNGFLREALK